MNRSDWYRLKDAVLAAGCGNFDYFADLPKRLQEHPVGVLLAEAEGGSRSAVREAERMLVPGAPEQASLILQKA